MTVCEEVLELKQAVVEGRSPPPPGEDERRSSLRNAVIFGGFKIFQDLKNRRQIKPKTKRAVIQSHRQRHSEKNETSFLNQLAFWFVVPPYPAPVWRVLTVTNYPLLFYSVKTSSQYRCNTVPYLVDIMNRFCVLPLDNNVSVFPKLCSGEHWGSARKSDNHNFTGFPPLKYWNMKTAGSLV